MRHQAHQKSQYNKPSKNHSLLASKFLKKDYEGLLSLLENQDIDREERKLLGYIFLKQNSLIQALISWSPLLYKLDDHFQTNMSKLASHIFSDSKPLDMAILNPEDLFPLFSTMKALHPQSQATQNLRAQIYNHLWGHGDLQSIHSLNKLVHSEKDVLEPSRLINLAKIKYLSDTTEDDLRHSIGIFISGAASYALQRIHICPFDLGLLSLGTLFKEKLKKYSFSNEAYIRLIDLEIEGLTRIFKKCQENEKIPKSLLSLSHYIQLLSNKKNEDCKIYLENLPYKDRSYYSIEHYEVLLLEADLADKKIIKSIRDRNPSSKERLKTKFLLAINGIRKQDVDALFLLENILPSLHLIRSDVNRIFLDLISSNTLWNEVWEFIFFSSPQLWDELMQNNIYAKIADLINANIQNSKHISTYLHRALQFSDKEELIHLQSRLDNAELTLKFINKTKARFSSLWSKCKTQEDVKNVLSNLIDSLSFTYFSHDIWKDSDQSGDAHGHTELEVKYCKILIKILEDKKLNQIFSLKPLLTGTSKENRTCIHYVKNNLIPKIRKNFSIIAPKLSVPEIKKNLQTAQILSTVNPFTFLDVARDVSKQEILRLIMEKIRTEPQKMPECRQVQSELFEGSKRIAHEFMNFVEIPSSPSILPLIPQGKIEDIELDSYWKSYASKLH